MYFFIKRFKSWNRRRSLWWTHPVNFFHKSFQFSHFERVQNFRKGVLVFWSMRKVRANLLILIFWKVYSEHKPLRFIFLWIWEVQVFSFQVSVFKKKPCWRNSSESILRESITEKTQTSSYFERIFWSFLKWFISFFEKKKCQWNFWIKFS
jgi:hypothetical protein